MPRGGKREGAGRKKNESDASDDGLLGKGFATRVLSRIKELKLKMVNGEPIKTAEDYALNMMAAGDAAADANFKLLLAYQLGKPVQPTMNADTRETRPELEYGNLLMPAQDQPRKADKPN